MDAVQDLAARAAAYMVVIQQLCVDHPGFFLQEKASFSLFKYRIQAEGLLREKAYKNDKFKERAVELIWINSTRVWEKNKTKASKEKDVKGEAVAKVLSRRLIELLKLISEWKELYEAIRYDEFSTSRWTEKDFNKDSVEEVKQSEDIENIPLPSPNQWRDYFCSILYKYPGQRTILAVTMGYMPSQIILAVVKGQPNPIVQRILQQWKVDDLELAVLADNAEIIVKKLEEPEKQLAERYLQNQLRLCWKENVKKNALPFELIFKRELSEIRSNRKMRAKELLLIKHNQPGNEDERQEGECFNIMKGKWIDPDPMLISKKMQLNALAFSGGGIRSATFNLGVLQALAKNQHLSKFDYISTVSGGGYIGSWLVAWIKREGSMLKVCNRLNRDKSGDPMAEEVRPVRWLRMYSNYLTPTTGIMSVDSWTVGMTLLRNMLLNQLIIFLLFMTTLVAGKLVFMLWVKYLIKIDDGAVFYLSSALIIAASVLAGIGMKFYHVKRAAENPIGILTKKNLSFCLLLMGYVTAIIISAWLSQNLSPDPGVLKEDYIRIILRFWPIEVIAFLGLFIVAALGRYDKCIPDVSPGGNLFARIEKHFGIPLIIIFSALATVIGAVALILAWQIIASLRQSCSFYAEKHGFYDYPNALTFILGPPLILEVLSIAIVMRMALLGLYFPDERREWWGRIGGHVHRIAFIWILVVGAALVGGAVVNDILPDDALKQLITAVGGWAVIIIGTVKAAFSPKSGGDQKPGPLSAVLGFLAKTGPYLFALGLLFFLPVLLNNILEKYFPGEQNDLAFLSWTTFILAVTTMLLAWRIGVNEFSMHHFYKNRLVRAYLGGTRSRVERKDSSSPFTGFDSQDDLPLSTLLNKEKYYGPYPILNTTLNASKVADLDRQDRKAESFIFSPLYCGFDFSPTRPSANEAKDSFDYGYRPTASYAYPPKGPHLGSAMSISGAAANPNMGFHSSPATAFLLTAFNVRLGWWIGNPRKKSWTSADPEFGLPYLISNLIGKSNTSDNYISLSDGGHFDNTGLYEMIRRRISFIVLGDAEQDDKFTCEALANTIRRCWIDFGVEIDIDVSVITNRKDGFSKSSFAVGKIIYPGNKPWLGVLIYLKSSVCKNQAVDIREYALKNPGFPHQTTGDQFFDEAQFESYRKLGYDIAMEAMANPVISALFDKI